MGGPLAARALLAGSASAAAVVAVVGRSRYEASGSMEVLSIGANVRGRMLLSAEEAKIRMMVASRFISLMSRFGVVVADYKVTGYIIEFRKWMEERNVGSAEAGESKEINDDFVARSGDWNSEVHPELAAVHRRTGQSMFDACASHGGLLVKLGQYISSNMAGVFPREYVEALEPLQDSCLPLDIETVQEVMRRELWKLKHGDQRPYNFREAEKLLHDTFDSIDPEPLGSASLAQVHRGYLRSTGESVAIKVQRPHLRVTTGADLAGLLIISKVVEWGFGTGFEWLLPEFHKVIAAELDFTQEARNAERCRNMIHGFRLFATWNGLLASRKPEALSTRHGASTAIVPKVYRKLTTPKMITMSFEEGFRVTDMEKLKEHGINPERVATATCSLFAELIFVHGFVHADPHPGNLLVRPRPSRNGEFDLVLLDHGMYRRLDESFRWSYANLWAGLISGDNEQGLRGVRSMGLADKYLDLLGVMLVFRLPSGVFEANSKLRWQKLGSIMGRESRQELKRHMQEKYGLHVYSPSSINKFMESQPRDLLFCMRCTSLVRGINRTLGGSTLDRFIVFGSAASRGTHFGGTMSGDMDGNRDVRAVEEAESANDNMDALEVARASLNRPVMSEVLARQRGHSSQTHSSDQEDDEDEASEKVRKSVLGRAETELWIREESAVMQRTLKDFLYSFQIAVRIWCRGILSDFLMKLAGVKEDVSSRRLG